MTWTCRRSSGPGVMAVMGLASSFAATAMLRSLGRARRAQAEAAEGDSMGIPPSMGGSPGITRIQGSPSYDPSGESRL